MEFVKFSTLTTSFNFTKTAKMPKSIEPGLKFTDKAGLDKATSDVNHIYHK